MRKLKGKIWRQIGGFTLIEVLIAAIIFSIVSLVSYSGLQSIIRTTEIYRPVAARFTEIAIGTQLLRYDVLSLIDRSIMDAFGNKRPSFMIADVKQADYFMELTRTNVPQIGLLYRSDMQRVSYQFDEKEKKLIRFSWDVLDQVSQSEPVEQVILTKIEALEVEGFQPNDEWTNRWNANDAGLPSMVRLKLIFEDWGELEIVLPIATEARN